MSRTEPGVGYEFVNAIKGGVIPTEYIKPVSEGIKEAMANGVLAGYPVVDIRAELYFGSYHDVDSNEMAFKIAGSMALQEGVKKANQFVWFYKWVMERHVYQNLIRDSGMSQSTLQRLLNSI